MLIELAIAVIGGVGLASVIVNRMDRQDAQRHPGGWQPRSEFDDHGGSVGQCPMCMANRENMATGRNSRQWEREADERAESLGRAQAERYSAEHQYQRPAEPERYNNQTERDVEMWQPPTREEFNRFANEAWQAIQAAPPSNTPDSIYWSPMETEQPDITSGIPQRQLEARNNDGSVDIGAHFSGSIGNYATANLRHEREQAGGQYVTIRGQQVWVED